MRNEIRPPVPMSQMLEPYPVRRTPWMDVARDEIGVHEIAGDASNPRILEFLRTVLKSWLPKFLRDETPWCAAFVNWCLGRCGIQGTGKPNAKSYLAYGEATANPQYGDIVVFKRGVLPWQGHVAFFVKFAGGGENRRVVVLGGNQHNQVCMQRRELDDVLGYRVVPI